MRSARPTRPEYDTTLPRRESYAAALAYRTAGPEPGRARDSLPLQLPDGGQLALRARTARVRAIEQEHALLSLIVEQDRLAARSRRLLDPDRRA